MGLAIVGVGSLWGMRTVDIEQARQFEDQRYRARVQSGDIPLSPEKRSDPTEQLPNSGENAAEASAQGVRG